MSRQAPTSLSPWEDRWSTPTLEQLFEPVEENRRRLVQMLIERIEDYEGIKSSLVWCGSSWRWTLQIMLDTGKGDPAPFAYVVPRPDGPLVCIPLSGAEIDKLPMKRLNRFVRDGIRSAKCAVSTHWCAWNPSAGTEVDHLTDLVKRVYKMRTSGDAAAA